MSSIHWREAWKYGERAFRYCQHDIGHALAALSYAAAGLLARRTAQRGRRREIGAWLGLDRAADFVADERETPDLFCRIDTGAGAEGEFSGPALSQSLQSGEWFGSAKRLSGRHFYRWPIIDQVAEHTLKPPTPAERLTLPALELAPPSQNPAASRLIRQRRSAQHFNGKSAPLPLADFYRIFAALLPAAKPPFTAWNWPAQVHIVLFVHRVDGIEPGLYFLPRSAEAADRIRPACAADYVWQRVDAPFELYRLQAGNVRQAAKTLSCHQPIASDSAFSLGMLARFADNVSAEAWRYRRLFWECGLLGRFCIWKRKRPACAAPASVVSSTMRYTACWACRTKPGKACTISRSASRWRITGYRRCRPMRIWRNRRRLRPKTDRASGKYFAAKPVDSD
ncbi:hypothetical protein [Methylomonas koyamae]|uniref:hypothetical protein n=1 Tax=Methylomonas koyamae TaxID=702114 RepID=UPI00210F7A9F|nr:hypothetical protein [Methylomonas koyamae]